MNRKIGLLLLLAAAAAGGTPYAGAQVVSPGFAVEQFTIEDGLPVNSINSLLTTPDGYLWLGTLGGLVRFDGIRFTTFTAGNTPGIPSNRIVALYRGRGESFHFSTERFDLVRVDPDSIRTIGRFPGQIRAVEEDADGETWIGSHPGPYRYRFTPGVVPEVRFDTDPAVAGTFVGDLHLDGSGVLWMTDMHTGSIRRRVGEQWSDVGTVPIVRDRGLRFFEDHSGRLWLGGKGLSRVRDGHVEAVLLEGPPANGPHFTVDGITQASDGSLVISNPLGPFRVVDGRVVVGGQGAGPSPDYSGANVAAMATCPDGRVWTHHRGAIFVDSKPAGRIAPLIRTMFCGRENNLWLGTDGGLFRVHRPEVSMAGVPEGLSTENVTNIIEDATGAVLVSGHGDTWDRLVEGSAPASYRHTANGAPFYLDTSGSLWHGAFRCPAERAASDGSCTRFEATHPTPALLTVRSILEDRTGTFWFGVLNGVFRLRDGLWEKPEASVDGPTTPVRYLLESRSGVLYMATFGQGIAVLAPDAARGDGRFRYLATTDGLSSDNIRGLFEDEDGSLWIATEDRGLNHYDPSTGRITVIRQADGLYSDDLHQVVADDFGRLWMSSNQGLFWVHRAGLKAFVKGDSTRVGSVFYTEQSGMRSREANGGFQFSAMKARDGRLWFATQSGVAIVDPAGVGDFLDPSPVLLEELQTARRRESLRGRHEVRLAAGERTFRIAYTSVNFSAPSRLQFRYRLEGYDDEWIDAGSRREAGYTGVPPGHYALVVAASQGDGTWSPVSMPLDIEIAPYPHETLAFRGLLLLGVLGLGWVTVRRRTRNLEDRRRQLEAEVEERTRELMAEKRRTEEQGEQLVRLDRLKSRFFANVSHEFRTPLTLTIGPLEDLRDDPELPDSAREGVEQALANSRRILRLINRLLDVARLEAGEMRLAASRQDLAAFVRVAAEPFGPLIERKGVHFDVQTPAVPVPVWFDAEKLEQVVVNLLSNAYKFTPEGGAIGVTVTVDRTVHPGHARVAVRDTGAGIPAELLPHVFDRFYQAGDPTAAPHGSSGIGLSLAQDLVLLHGGTLTVESTPRFGSTFTVTLKLGREHLDDDQVAASAPRDVSVSVVGQIDGLDDLETVVDAGADDSDDRFTVLVADDNADIRAYVRRHMERQYRVLEAANGVEALDLVRRTIPDVVVSDIMMPVLDGLGLLAAIRADRDTDFIPVVLLTAKAGEEDLLQGLEAGADAYVTKPFSMRELQLRIDGLIAGRLRLRRRFQDPRFERPGPTPDVAAPRELSGPDAVFLRRVAQAIDEGLGDENFDVQRLADALRLSRNTLHRRLRSMGAPAPSEALRRARLERAAALLARNEWNVSEVAYAVGFRSVSYFSYCFHEAYGVTPSTYSWRAADLPGADPEGSREGGSPTR